MTVANKSFPVVSNFIFNYRNYRFLEDGPVWPTQYSDWLWPELSADRVPVWASFSLPVQIDPGAQPAQ